MELQEKHEAEFPLGTRGSSKYAKIRRGISAVVLTACFLQQNFPVKAAHATEINDAKEALTELLDKTSFDALGRDIGYDRLLLWEKDRVVRYNIAVDVDGITSEWLRTILTQVYKTLDINDNPLIDLRFADNMADADIVILSSKKSILNHEPYMSFFKEKFQLSDETYNSLLDMIEGGYAGDPSVPSEAWLSAVVTIDPVSRRKTLRKFWGIIKPTKEPFQRSFPAYFLTALGYGNNREHYSVLRSVHTTPGPTGLDGSDQVILRFLYGSKVKNGTTREEALKLFRRWLDSEDFRKLGITLHEFDNG